MDLGWVGCVCTQQEPCSRGQGISRALCFVSWGPGWGMMLIFFLGQVAGEGRGVFAMRVGAGHASPT